MIIDRTGSITIHTVGHRREDWYCVERNANNCHYTCTNEFIGLGFLAVLTILLVEIFGSPFMKSGSLIIALAVGSIVAAACGYCINKTRESPVITFIWVHTFKLRLDPPSILPIMAIYLVNSIEALGDVTAASEASRLTITGDKFDERIQGGILADGLAGIFAGAMTQAPMSIFGTYSTYIKNTNNHNMQLRIMA